MPDHRYQQYCALARALDVAGDRWTLLIVRELVPGPRRFTDLLDGLPGVSRNLLTERLRDLERDGIVTRQELPPPAARQVYELTDDGLDLAAAIGPLIAWGAQRMSDREPTDSFHPRWAAVGMSVLADRDAASGVRETYQFVIDRSAFHFVIDDGTIHLRDGLAEDPAVTWSIDEETWSQIASGTLTASAAIDTGALTIQGDPKAANRLRKIFSRTQMLARARRTARHERSTRPRARRPRPK
jgi:DNA-binding HxlR family transcriptional regulator/putative sterol carrier protein